MSGGLEDGRGGESLGGGSISGTGYRSGNSIARVGTWQYVGLDSHLVIKKAGNTIKINNQLCFCFSLFCVVPFFVKQAKYAYSTVQFVCCLFVFICHVSESKTPFLRLY